jgi:hypothetical protein
MRFWLWIALTAYSSIDLINQIKKAVSSRFFELSVKGRNVKPVTSLVVKLPI